MATPIESAGSLDDVQDAIDALNRDGSTYILVVGRPGERCTRAWSKNRGNTDERSIGILKEVLDEHLERYFTLPDDR